jgi:hypothetical protein
MSLLVNGELPPTNADRLREVAARGRARLDDLSEADRVRRGDAIAAVDHYVALLRAAAPRVDCERYAFKLEFPDGRWDVIEQTLADKPRVGDLVWFEGLPWQILGHHRVPKPQADAQHEFLACAPAAA